MSVSPAMSEPSGSEHRHMPRVEQHFMVRYRLVGGPVGEQFISPLRDLSRSGARWFSELPLRNGARLELSLSLPTAPQPVHVQAKVVWTKPARLSMTELGVTFEPVDAKTQGMIDEVVGRFLRRTATG